MLMTDVLVRYNARVADGDGTSYLPQVCGGPAGDGLWEGWIEFVAESGAVLCSPRETEQHNRDSLMYWAQGITLAYLEGALSRAVAPHVPRSHEPTTRSRFVEPATGRTSGGGGASHAVLDPFTAFAQGEALLRGQLAALSRDHLVTIVKAYRLDVKAPHEAVSEAMLVEAIVAAVRRQANG